ncbi:hypothetical protein [Brachybacterium sp. GPGPB12]|uniref:hypothetical protein n=1 Tax=Brachybacterium sp. GPGPB12 TaxID=3023517 RepID=UPI0031344F6F
MTVPTSASGGSDGGGEGSAFADVIASGPVAADDAVAGGAWAAAIKEKDQLIRGGTVANQVFSLASTTGGRPPASTRASPSRWRSTSSARAARRRSSTSTPPSRPARRWCRTGPWTA